MPDDCTDMNAFNAFADSDDDGCGILLRPSDSINDLDDTEHDSNYEICTSEDSINPYETFNISQCHSENEGNGSSLPILNSMIP